MSLILKNTYDERQARSACGRCGSALTDGSAHCQTCKDACRDRMQTYRTLNRAHYNATMRAWKAKQKAA